MPAAPAAPRPDFRHSPYYLIGVVLPLASLVFELLTHGSLEVYFDPIPSWLHVLLVASVPAAVGLAGHQLGRDRPTRVGCGAAGFAAGISAVYTVLYLPILPLSGLGVIFFGIGLLPFAPLGGLVAALHLGLVLARSLPGGRALYAGSAAGGVLLLALLDLPGWIVAHGLETGSVERLERWGSRSALLRAAQRGTGEVNLSAHLWYGPDPLRDDWSQDREDRIRNRTLFYRVTGEDSLALAPPPLTGVPDAQLFGGRARGAAWTDESGGLAPGLSLDASRIDVAAFGDEGVGYLEWTLVFRNDAPFVQEATARLLLPPGGVVTRANLWIDGELREAAFGPRAQVREAYESVVRTRRDPLLVTSDREGEAAIRAFPIPGDGGTMRVRVGVTAPLALLSPERAALAIPQLAEHNFAVPDTLSHSVWVDSRTPVLEAPPALARRPAEGSVETLRGQLPIGGDELALLVERRAGSEPLWVADGAGESAGFIRQSVTTRPPREERWVVVVDGSHAAAPHHERIASALAGVPRERIAGVVVAGPAPVWLLGGDGTDPAGALEVLREFPFSGGRDNLPALEAAWDRAWQEGAGVLWICTGQPMLLGAPDALAQRLERRPDLPIAVLPLAPVRNALLDALPARAGIELERAPTPAAALAALAGGSPAPLALQLERVTDTPAGARVRSADDPVAIHLARLWASDEVGRRLARGTGADASAAALAARYRVVTPASGAVVLESDAQYAAAGLETPEGSDVDLPPIPEPSAVLLFGLGLALVEAQRRRYGQGNSSKGKSAHSGRAS